VAGWSSPKKGGSAGVGEEIRLDVLSGGGSGSPESGLAVNDGVAPGGTAASPGVWTSNLMVHLRSV